MRFHFQKMINFIARHALLMAVVLLIIVLALFLKSLFSADWTPNSNTTYFGTTDKPITVSWDAVTGADYYNVELVSVERGTTVAAGTGRATTTQLTFSLPFAGHFIAKVQACKTATPPICSVWAASDDPTHASVDNQAKAWWIYGHVAAPGPIQIK